MATPMKLSAANRRRPTLLDGVVVVVVVLVAVLVAAALRPQAAARLTAVVLLDGAELARYDLTALTDPVEYAVPGKYPLTIRAERGRICILETSCPGKDCLHTGWIHTPGAQIVCLPNRLIVSLTGTGDGVDATTG